MNSPDSLTSNPLLNEIRERHKDDLEMLRARPELAALYEDWRTPADIACLIEMVDLRAADEPSAGYCIHGCHTEPPNATLWFRWNSSMPGGYQTSLGDSPPNGFDWFPFRGPIPVRSTAPTKEPARTAMLGAQFAGVRSEPCLNCGLDFDQHEPADMQGRIRCRAVEPTSVQLARRCLQYVRHHYRGREPDSEDREVTKQLESIIAGAAEPPTVALSNALHEWRVGCECDCNACQAFARFLRGASKPSSATFACDLGNLSDDTPCSNCEKPLGAHICVDSAGNQNVCPAVTKDSALSPEWLEQFDRINKRTKPTDETSDALALAIRFHEAYERLAHSFGYETRPDTRAFDPTSKNGKLMVAVCAEIAAPVQTSKHPCWCPYCGEPHGVHRSEKNPRHAVSEDARP
jgi:hypothetical protein